MNWNKVVYVLVGQRGAGKSTYTERILEVQPEISLISRDDILIERFGYIDGDKYEGNLGYGEDETFRRLRETLTAECDSATILDYWTWSSDDRQSLIRLLRSYGATKVVALYFTTPLALVSEWFWKKPGIARESEMEKRQGEGLTFFLEDAPEHDFKNFHRLATSITADGFDEVIPINPLDPLVTL